jgi:hypothetical protein
MVWFGKQQKNSGVVWYNALLLTTFQVRSIRTFRFPNGVLMRKMGFKLP